MKPLNSSQELNQTNEQKDALLDKYFSEVKKERYDTSSIPLFDWIDNAGGITGGKYITKKKSIPSEIFSRYRQRLVLAIFLIAAVSISMTVPVKQSQTVANVLSWKINKSNKDGIKKLENIDGIDKNLLTAELNDPGDSSNIVFKLILPNPDPDKINKLQIDLKNLSGVGDVQLTPIDESYSRPVYSYVMNKLFDVQVSTPHIDESAARSNISKQIEIAGLPPNFNFDFVPNASGFNIVNASYHTTRDTIKYYRDKNILIAPDADEIIKQVDKMMKIQSLRMDSLQAEISKQVQKSFTPEMMQSMENIVDKVNLGAIMDNVKESLQAVKEMLNSGEFKKQIFMQNKTYLDSLKNFNREQYKERMEEYKERMQDLKENLKDYEENMQDFKENLKDYDDEMKEGMKEYEEGMKEYKQGMDELRQQMKEMKIDINKEDIEDYREGMKEYEEGMKEYKKGMEDFKQQMKDFKIDINTEDFNKGMEDYKKGMEDFKQQMQQLKIDLKGLGDSLKLNLNIDTNMFRFYSDSGSSRKFVKPPKPPKSDNKSGDSSPVPPKTDSKPRSTDSGFPHSDSRFPISSPTPAREDIPPSPPAGD